LFAKNITGELYIGCAETDDWAPAEMIESLDAYLAETGINYRIEWYPDTHHGFVFPQRELYHKDASERHWERMLAMFKRQL
jgi:carboxymethylenebutenolidase